MLRYRLAGVEPPKLLNVDRDCCNTRTRVLFPGWDNLVIRLDVWHFMRRLSSACTRERTLGNSPTELRKQILEQHSETHLHRCLQCLTDCSHFITTPAELPSFAATPGMTGAPRTK
ncbi:Hypp90 [Branchiostoma lanceolatum]|uniref:Hypp90 protein n=1 Tax=Branchiostoma lanceolatum TaxID=7740 RepID=A0A8J9WBI6_BRALA|nr:Hypp90 [Branchiostoma lanceolatum]